MAEERQPSSTRDLWDPGARSFRSDPYPALHRLRAADPVHRTKNAVVLTRYDDVASTLRDPAFGMGPRQDLLAGLHAQLGTGRAFDYVSRRLVNYDPPDHTRLRSLVNRAFTPRRVEALRPWIEELARTLLDPVAERSGFDVIEVLAHPLPSLVICELLGAPDADRGAFDRWTSTIAHLTAPYVPADLLAAGEAAVSEEWACLEFLIDERRRRPGDDLLSALITVESEGQRLDLDELIAMVIFLFSAGHQTTRDLIGNGLLGLFAYPDQFARLAADPRLGPAAAEECLRYDGPVAFTARKALGPTTIQGAAVQPGEWVICFLAAANRDPARNPDPDVFRIERTDRHVVSFGGGIHNCLGSALARMEADIILRVLLHRLPRLQLATNEIRWRDTITFRGPVALPVTT